MKGKTVYYQLAGILIFVVLIYQSTLVWLFQRCISADTYYSHGFLIPLIAAFLIWQKRGKLKKIRWEYDRRGLYLIVLSLVVHSVCMLLGVYFISGFSILSLFFGVSLFLFGRKITRVVLFPLSFLIFMFPVPLVAINLISLPLKVLVTNISVYILRFFLDLPLQHEGFRIIFPKTSVIIDNPCSGLRSLIVMLALGSLFAYFLKAKLSKRVLLFFLSIPMAMISNIIRVILLSLGVYIYGSQFTGGFFHDFTGYLVFVFAFAGMWLSWRKLQCKDI